VAEVIQEPGTGFLGIVVQEELMLELKGLNTLIREHPDQTIEK